MVLEIPATAMLAVMTLFLNGILLVSIGLTSVYIAKIHHETLNRPLFVIRKNNLTQLHRGIHKTHLCLKVIVTADDFGLTRSATDTVLQCFDNGSLTRVSIIPNGYAVEYALGEWQKRSGRLSLSIHLNLTEGKALSKPKDIPHLVDSRGNFKHSPFSLLVRTFFALPNKRRLIATEIKNELTAQIQRIRAHVSNASIGIDGHQHVHVIPIVFSEIFQLHKQYGFELIRLPYEPFFWATTSLRAYSVFGLGRHFVLNFFSRIIAKKYIKNNLPRTDFS